MNAIYWGWQKEPTLLENKLDSQRLESEIKIEEFKSRIESIRDESKIERERIIAKKKKKKNRSNKLDRIKEDMKEKRAKITLMKN